MLLKIDDNTTIEDLQDKFNECFPHLKIEFFQGQHALKENKPVQGIVRISDISKNYQTGVIEIKSWYKVEKVLLDIKHQLSLSARVYRLQGQHYVPLNKDEHINTRIVSEKMQETGVETELQNDEEIGLFI